MTQRREPVEVTITVGDILVGMNVGSRHWETIRPDNILYILRQTESTRAAIVQYYIVRRNAIHALKDITARSAPERMRLPIAESHGIERQQWIVVREVEDSLQERGDRCRDRHARQARSPRWRIRHS